MQDGNDVIYKRAIPSQFLKPLMLINDEAFGFNIALVDIDSE